MSGSTIAAAAYTFATRLATLEHLLHAGAQHVPGGGDAVLALRLAPDMHPLGTQIAFTCNQPRNFALWLGGAAASDLDPAVDTLATGLGLIGATRALLAGVAADDTVLAAPKRLDLPGGLYADLTGRQYLDDFLLPNFYFHLVTAYAILRMTGVPLGKRDYMLHLLPLVRQAGS